MLDLDLSILSEVAFQLVAAIVLALPTAYNRERHSRIMGLRTFPLVAMGACAYVLVGRSLSDDPDVLARVVQGLITGVGFVGGGAILKHDDHVQGTASAASIWITGGLGAAIAMKQWEIALMLSVLNFLVVWALSFVKEEIREHADGE